jgi:alpha-D-xyloside xylohydrolase
MLDPFIPAARQLVWEKVRAGYFDAGIEMFWLDDTEPNVHTGGLEYACGLAEHCGALWPNRWIETFTEGLRREGVASPVILTRAGWAGMQTTGAVLWSSDIPASWESLRIQVRAGLSTDRY